ncbi:MAG TPA: histidine kinase [Casimicrobiaceae bacterium]|nr:histidine kinase [Casimicrobiaceae bacterium]
MTPLSVDRPHADQPLANPLPGLPRGDFHAHRGGAYSASPDSPHDDELHAVLAPMLEAIVHLAGADAGTIRVIGPDGTSFEPVVTIGLRQDNGVPQLWCSTCAESRNADSECVRTDLCGHNDRVPAEVLGPVCKHQIAVPLRHKDRPVGALNLMFREECALPPAMTPLLCTAGDLLGMTLENSRLSGEILRVRLTSERQMLASEVHDSLAQGLTYMRMRMNLLGDAIRGGDELRARKYCGDIDDALENSQRRLRELITYFRSRMDPHGLLHAFRENSERFFDRTGVALAFESRIPDLCLPPEREIEVFHIVQEALANVSRHAHARRAQLVIDRRGDEYAIVVEDDGIGIADSAETGSRENSGHYGIAIMRERAHRLGGKITLIRAAGNGTRLELTFPVLPS